MKDIYAHKPKEIKSAKDLLKFVKGIPAKFWCVDQLQNEQGQCCVLGHLGAAFGGHYLSGFDYTDGFEPDELIGANNGRSQEDRLVSFNWDTRKPSDLTGKSIKARLIKFLTENLDRK